MKGKNANYKKGSLPNFEKLTALLNQQKNPRKTLDALVLLAKPACDCGYHRSQEPKVIV